MHIVSSISLLILLFMNPAGFVHAENWLKGQVLENHGGVKKLAAGAQVWIVNVGNPYLTQSDGGYRVLVPDAYRVGQTIILFVKRKGWDIATPVGGEVVLSKEFTTDILLSPNGSLEFLLPAHLARLLESIPEKMMSQVISGGDSSDTDPAQVVKNYAAEHHLKEDDVLAGIDALIRQWEQSRDVSKYCLASIYRKTVYKKDARRLIAGCFRKVGLPDGREQLSQAELEEWMLKHTQYIEEELGPYKTFGDSFYANHEFERALEYYMEGLKSVAHFPTLRADMQWRIGTTKREIAIRSKHNSTAKYLSEAEKSYREAQTIYTKEKFPQAWASIENDLGTVLWAQGIRTRGEASTQLLAQAVEAYHAALTVITKETSPQYWALAQFNLGTMYEEGLGVEQDFMQAADFYRRACDGGMATGCSDLAVQYMRGLGMPSENETEALRYFRKACDLKDKIGCKNYALLKNGKLR